MADADEAVLARASELYAEGMALEEANDPQQALDRYRRAVRMADERRILARLQARPDWQEKPPAPHAAAAPAVAAAAQEEDFQLWQALHLSRLEAQAADAGAASAGAAAAEAAPAAPGPPPERQAAGSPAFAPPARGPWPRQGALDEATEVADWFALRSLHKTLDIGSEPTAPSASAASAAAAARVAAARPRGPDAEEVEQASALLRLVLPETLPRVLSLLDAYGLDRLSASCQALRGPAHSCTAWLALARRCLPREDLEGALAATERALAGRGAHGPWRRAVLLAPRLRADGVYIANCGYRRRVQKGASIADARESLYIRYFRLLRVLPEEDLQRPRRRVLVLTYEGDLKVAVEALKTHPAGREGTLGRAGARLAAEPPGHVRKVQERVVVGTYGLDSDSDSMMVTVRYTDARNDYVMEFKLLHARKNGSRQNCRLTWERYEFTSLRVPQESASFDLRREQHYSPYAFARVRALEHLL